MQLSHKPLKDVTEADLQAREAAIRFNGAFRHPAASLPNHSRHVRAAGCQKHFLR